MGTLKEGAPRPVTTASRSRKRCPQCRSSRKKCISFDGDSKCLLCEKAGKPCGPIRTAKEEREAKGGFSLPTSAEGSVAGVLHEEDSKALASSEEIMFVNSREMPSVDMFSRNVEDIDSCFQKLGILVVSHKTLTYGQETFSSPITPSSVALVSQRYALKEVVREIEWTTQELIKLADSASGRQDRSLVDRILLRIFDVVQSIADLSVQIKCTALEKIALFYAEMYDEERVQKALQILLTLVGSPGVEPKISPHRMLAGSMLRTSRILRQSFVKSGISAIAAPICSPALHQTMKCESPDVFYATLKIIKGRSRTCPTPWTLGNNGINPPNCPFDDDEDIETRDTFGRTPLHFAAILGKAEFCNALLREGARADQRDCTSRTILAAAAGEGSTVIINQLLMEGAVADPPRLDREPTPLEEAAAGGRLDIVNLLLDKGAGKWKSRTIRAVEIARSNCYDAAAKAIEDYPEEMWGQEFLGAQFLQGLESDPPQNFDFQDPSFNNWYYLMGMDAERSMQDGGWAEDMSISPMTL